MAIAILEKAPDRVESLVVVATATDPEVIDGRMDAMLHRLDTEGYQAVVDSYYENYIDARQELSLARDSDYKEIPSCSHAIPTEKPAELVAQITAWWTLTP
ncbi:MAG: hypothetical protein CL398_08680 [Acidiferrobacteraceae bacterium]|nr:hypothetical protein [Acidiferrobacteraceae bacterium]